MSGDTVNVWQDIELSISPYHFCTSCHISSTNKSSRSKNILKSKVPLKWVFMDIIPATLPKMLTSETGFSDFLLIVDT